VKAFEDLGLQSDFVADRKRSAYRGTFRMKYRVVIPLLLATSLASVAAAHNRSAQDWLMFGGNVQSTSANLMPTRITAANVAQLRRRQVQLDGLVDASAIYLHGVTIRGARHDAIFVTTSYGKTIALDAGSGDALWEYTPPSYEDLAGTPQFTNSTPVADPNRQFIYAASPDGYIQKLAVSDGHRLWRTSITKLPQREKMDSPLKFFRGHVIAVTAGYFGDQPPYQGHVAILDGGTGALLQVWNSLCSDRAGLMEPSSCAQTQSGIWGRAGAVIDPGDGDIFAATGNGVWNGQTDWGDALIELNASATEILGNYTPVNSAELDADDLDLGSTSPVLLGGDLLAQGGKDGKIRLLSRKANAGTAPHEGHELQIVPTPSGTDLFSQPAVWQRGGHTWMFAADNGGTAAWELQNGKLQQKWNNDASGTSPFEAGGLLFVYAVEGGLNVYEAASGKHIATLPCGPGHWNSPIVLDGDVILPEGNANDRAASGVLDIWSLPGGR
jgi:PQQ-like domain